MEGTFPSHPLTYIFKCRVLSPLPGHGHCQPFCFMSQPRLVRDLSCLTNLNLEFKVLLDAPHTSGALSPFSWKFHFFPKINHISFFMKLLLLEFILKGAVGLTIKMMEDTVHSSFWQENHKWSPGFCGAGCLS